ncbi:unnamed protein product [Brassicogethes aeneus]|uniref:Major facilitator superfamily (MFS) profile domain-containing protein n=1 Tax=Brassicogethes aeneus TaxID=1431903 RepID=A0A9P0AP08_BRAAE|nr:unnamed protein product [Brassicogethes aeneus]
MKSKVTSVEKKHRNKIYQYVAAFTANLGIICSEMHYGWPSPSLPILINGNYTFQITSEEGSWIAVIPLIGAIFGAFVTGLVVDHLGRKKMVIFSSFPFVVSWLMIGLAKSSTLLYVGRFIAGATDGMSFTAVPMYLGEISEPRIRGLLASVCPVSIVLGLLLINVLGSYLPIDTTAYIATIIPILLFLLFIWMPESPYFHLIKGNKEAAKKSLVKFRGTTNVDEELDRMALGVKEQNENTGKFFDLFTVKCNRKALFIAFGLRTVQQLSGTTAIIIYCKTIFNEARHFMAPNIGPIIFFMVQLIMSAISSSIVDLTGRRPLLIISITGTSFTLLLNGIFLYIKNCTEIDTTDFNFVPIIALIGFVVIFSVGLQTIPLLVMGEIFPTNVKAFALCTADIYFSVIATLVSKFFHWTNEAFGMHVPFFVFTFCCVVGLFFILHCVPETKGKTLEDIQRLLKGEELQDYRRPSKIV